MTRVRANPLLIKWICFCKKSAGTISGFLIVWFGMEFIKDFKNINKDNVEIAGGKGASLGEMTQAGLPVPPGFVVLAGTFDFFLKETDINVEIDAVLDTVDHKVVHTVQDASEKIQAMILNAVMPKEIQDTIQSSFEKLDADLVAVRSSATSEDSATAAWAGQLDTFLNTTSDELIENIKKCWASLFTPRAIFYRFEKELHQENISVAVVVQKMIDSDVSGIAFSVHPVTEDPNQMIIEAAFGLGEAIVSGQVTPDAYVVDKETFENIDINVNQEKQVLSEDQILNLAKEVVKIESHYGFPVDVEWAMKDGELFILQSRPITTLSPKLKDKVLNIDDYYQCLFRVIAGGVAFLTSDVFRRYYETLQAILTVKDGVWTSYIPIAVRDQLLEEGIKLYSNRKAFEEYQTAFNTYIKFSDTYFDKILNKKNLTKSDVKKGYETADKHFSFYSKTEFFYTDKAYELSLEANQQELRENLSRLEEVKNNGREHLNRMFFGGDGYISRMSVKVARQFGVSEEDVYLYKVQEVIDLFDHNRVSAKELKRRLDSFVTISDGGSTKYLVGDEAIAFINKFEEKQNVKGGVLRGMSANVGKVTGRVKIIPSDYYFDFSVLDSIIDSMNEGDVLVAETTSPELMRACKKASAIITDQGGLLSHAAIVSREMEIPCIVAVSNATQVLKDGDEVEVDANNGVVRKI